MAFGSQSIWIFHCKWLHNRDPAACHALTRLILLLLLEGTLLWWPQAVMFCTGANDLWLDARHTEHIEHSRLHFGQSLLVCPGAELPDADGARARLPAARHLLCHAAMPGPDLGRQLRRHRTLLWPRQMSGASQPSLPLRTNLLAMCVIACPRMCTCSFALAGLRGRQCSQCAR